MVSTCYHIPFGDGSPGHTSAALQALVPLSLPAGPFCSSYTASQLTGLDICAQTHLCWHLLAVFGLEASLRMAEHTPVFLSDVTAFQQ
jgi:hypothetical protein